ncbi:MAG: dUTP diphosphatase, partial [Candidatus Eisenbacteria bacterium]|nr:dUTP diphosphatase [Candidatus Eisenbacteria bacterium]
MTETRTEAVRVLLRRLHPGARLPRRQSRGASGWDLHACLDADLTLAPGRRTAVPTGWAVAVPAGYELQIRPRSGLSWRHGVTVVNAPGTIDEDYRGEVRILLVNLGREPFGIRNGDRVAQMVLAAVPRGELAEVPELPETGRGEGGFGHTGLGED